MEGFEAASDAGVTVVLDTNLTPELIEEGFVREVVSKLQTMRKEADFEVTDHIVVSASDNARMLDIIKRNEAAILADVLGVRMVYEADQENSREWNLNGEMVRLGVARAGC